MTDRKAKWRERHPERERARRDLDNEARRYRRSFNRARGLPENTPLPCQSPGCPSPAQIHHLPSGGFELLCRSHHQHSHNDLGSGPGSNGPNRGLGAVCLQDGIAHHPRNGRTSGTIIGLRHED